MSHSDQQNMMGRTRHNQQPHPEHIQTFQNNLKRGLLLAGFKYEVCLKKKKKPIGKA